MQQLLAYFRWSIISIIFMLFVACGSTENIDSSTTVTDETDSQMDQTNLQTGTTDTSVIDSSLTGTAWRLIEMNGNPFPSHIVTTLIFNEDALSGYNICNDWSSTGGFIASGGSFDVPVVRKTLNGCLYASLEKEVTNTLTLNTQAYKIESQYLSLLNEDGDTVLLFTNELDTSPHPPIPQIVTDQQDSGAFFIQSKTKWQSNSIEITGEFSRTGNCLRLKNELSNVLLIWPSEFSLVENENQLSIVNPSGDEFVVADGTVTLTGIELYPPDTMSGIIPDECEGPYFVVTN